MTNTMTLKRTIIGKSSMSANQLASPQSRGVYVSVRPVRKVTTIIPSLSKSPPNARKFNVTKSKRDEFILSPSRLRMAGRRVIAASTAGDDHEDGSEAYGYEYVG